MNPEQEQYRTPRKMKALSSLFLRYEGRLKPPQASVEKVCIEVIAEVTSMKLTKDQVKYTVSTRTIAVLAPSLIKSEIRFHHTKILKQLQNQLGEKHSPKVML